MAFINDTNLSFTDSSSMNLDSPEGEKKSERNNIVSGSSMNIKEKFSATKNNPGNKSSEEISGDRNTNLSNLLTDNDELVTNSESTDSVGKTTICATITTEDSFIAHVSSGIDDSMDTDEFLRLENLSANESSRSEYTEKLTENEALSAKTCIIEHHKTAGMVDKIIDKSEHKICEEQSFSEKLVKGISGDIDNSVFENGEKGSSEISNISGNLKNPDLLHTENILAKSKDSMVITESTQGTESMDNESKEPSIHQEPLEEELGKEISTESSVDDTETIMNTESSSLISKGLENNHSPDSNAKETVLEKENKSGICSPEKYLEVVENSVTAESVAVTMEYDLNPIMIYTNASDNEDSNAIVTPTVNVERDDSSSENKVPFEIVKMKDIECSDFENGKLALGIDTNSSTLGLTKSLAPPSTMTLRTENGSLKVNKTTLAELENNKELNQSENRKYPCSLCAKRFHHRGNLLRHEATHSGKKGFPCSICGKEFARENYLNAHKRIHTEERAFNCEICGKGFYWKSCLTRHLEAHKNIDDFTCTLCGKVFFNKSYLVDHMVVHTKEKLFKCEVCGKGFSFKLSLRKHMVLHSNKKEFKCDICGKDFFHKSGLNLHMITHTVERDLRCMLCGINFATKALLSEHMALHSGEFKCDLCGAICPSKSSLIDHLTLHNGLLKCDICEESFTNGVSYVEHREKHSSITDTNLTSGTNGGSIVKVEEGSVHNVVLPLGNIKIEDGTIIKVEEGLASSDNMTLGTNLSGINVPAGDRNVPNPFPNLNLLLGTGYNNLNVQEGLLVGSMKNTNLASLSERRFPCSLCDKRFHSRANLLRHEVVHSGKKGFPCTICGKEFSREYNLITHKRIHTEEKNFKCDICGKGFYWKSCLSRHMGAHTDKDDFTCHICGKVFFNKSYVVGHMVVHTKEKVFKCDICDKGFSFKVSLRKHKVMHTNKKDFKCDICGKEFFQKSNLNYHRMTHTSEREVKCELCNKVFTSKSYLADHMALHTGEFKCDICGKHFARNKLLLDHKAKHYNNEIEDIPMNQIKGNQKGNTECTICGKVYSRPSRLKNHMKVHAKKGEILPHVATLSESISESTGKNTSQSESNNIEEINIDTMPIDEIKIENMEVDEQGNFAENMQLDILLGNVKVERNDEDLNTQNSVVNENLISRNANTPRYRHIVPRIQNVTSQAMQGNNSDSSLPMSESGEGEQTPNAVPNVNYNLINQLSIIRYLMAVQSTVQSAIVTQTPNYSYGAPLLLPGILAAARVNTLKAATSNESNSSPADLTIPRDSLSASESESLTGQDALENALGATDEAVDNQETEEISCTGNAHQMEDSYMSSIKIEEEDSGKPVDTESYS